MPFEFTNELGSLRGELEARKIPSVRRELQLQAHAQLPGNTSPSPARGVCFPGAGRLFLLLTLTSMSVRFKGERLLISLGRCRTEWMRESSRTVLQKKVFHGAFH